jgi:ATP-binding cassette subfamily F protein 3
MAQSRIKKLERMQLVSEIVEEEAVRLVFNDPTDVLSPPILQLVDVGFKYASNQAPIFSNINMNIDTQSRIALVGANGSGKSTLMKLLSGELTPTSGMVLRNPKVRFAQFSQHFVDQLDLSLSALEYFHMQYPLMGMQDIRSHLGGFGLSGDLALRTMSALSGGQKSRVVFAMMAKTTPHILLLDEPSNHLDIETIEGLARSLTTYQGGMLLVSHDERLITLVCDEIWRIHDGQVLPFDGDFDDYKDKLIADNTFVSIPKKMAPTED